MKKYRVTGELRLKFDLVIEAPDVDSIHDDPEAYISIYEVTDNAHEYEWEIRGTEETDEPKTSKRIHQSGR